MCIWRKTVGSIPSQSCHWPPSAPQVLTALRLPVTNNTVIGGDSPLQDLSRVFITFVTVNLHRKGAPVDTQHLYILGVMDYLSAEISTSKQKKFSLVTFVDTPGLVDGDMIYPFDVNSAITWFGRPWQLGSISRPGNAGIFCSKGVHCCVLSDGGYFPAQGSRRTWSLCSSTPWARRCANAHSTSWRSWVRSVETSCCSTSARQTRLGRKQTDR